MKTPQILAKKITKTLGLSVPVYLKREDLHPYGSHKGRSLPLMINAYVKQGYIDFVISSSGNAALAAGLHIKKYNQTYKNKLTLKIFIGQKIDKAKQRELTKLANTHIQIIQTANPKQAVFQIAKNKQIKLLRQSTDDLALVGYKSLAKELSAIKKLSAVFIPTSSGATAQGLYLGFKKFQPKTGKKLKPQINIIQTCPCHPIAEKLGAAVCHKEEKSLAKAIVDKVAHRKLAVINAVQKSNGQAFIASNQEIKKAIKLAKKEKINVSPNSALSLVGLMRAIKTGQKFTGPIVCLITGR